jgi:hypothetical protein
MGHTVESAAAQIDALRVLLADQGRSSLGASFQIVLGATVATRADVARWETLGVTRLIVSPWRRSSEAIDALRRFADRTFD